MKLDFSANNANYANYANGLFGFKVNIVYYFASLACFAARE
jgi:hypothetical protein